MEHNGKRAGTPDIRSAEGFAEMVKRIVAEHVVNGSPVYEYTIGAAEK